MTDHEPGTGVWMWAQGSWAELSTCRPEQRPQRDKFSTWYNSDTSMMLRDHLDALRGIRGPTDPNELWWVPTGQGQPELVTTARWTADGRRVEVEGG